MQNPNQQKKLAQKLELLQEKIHFRKVNQISTESEHYLKANLQFNKRQENILLNALQFINDVAERDGHDSSEDGRVEDGVDEGHVCRLDKEQREQPEFQALIQEGEVQSFDVPVPSYALRAKNYRKFLNQM